MVVMRVKGRCLVPGSEGYLVLVPRPPSCRSPMRVVVATAHQITHLGWSDALTIDGLAGNYADETRDVSVLQDLFPLRPSRL
jgi:hypothetical protein